MKAFGWVITKDHINDGESEGYGRTMGAREPGPIRDHITKNGQAFRLFDDDGELYYEGRFLMGENHTGFEPLDWAMNNAGCTEIKFYEHQKGWRTL